MIALALAMKAFVPVGYMIGSTSTSFTVEICDGQGGHVFAPTTIPNDSDSTDHQHSKAAKDCPFTALSMHSLAAADDGLLVLAMAFIMAIGFAPLVPLRLTRIGFLTPPQRGPPLLT